MMLNEINKHVFKESLTINGKDRVSLVMFHSKCPDCNIMEQQLIELEKEMDEYVDFFVYETKVQDRITKEYGVDKMPHISIFMDGFLVNEFRGLTNKNDIKQYLDSLSFLRFDDGEEEDVAADTNAEEAAELLALGVGLPWWDMLSDEDVEEDGDEDDDDAGDDEEDDDQMAVEGEDEGEEEVDTMEE